MRSSILRLARLQVIWLLTLLAACGELQQQFPILSLLKTAPKPPPLVVRPQGIPAMPQYRPVSLCRYNGRMSEDGHVQSDDQQLTVRAIRNRLLVTSTIGGAQSTALITRSGERVDFNAADASGGRFTPESFKNSQGETGPAMNNMDMYIPPFESGPMQPGRIASRLRDSSGTVQAALIYKGLTTYQNREAILLDIVRIYNGSSVGQTIGFSLVDRQRALPLLTAAAGRPSMRVTQLDCRD